MKRKYYILGILLFGILILSNSFGNTIAYEDGNDDVCDGEEPCNGEEPKDIEENDKRYVEIWFGENVVEAASIRRSDEKKDIMDLRIGYNEEGICIAVSFRTVIKHNDTQCEEDLEPKENGELEIACEGYCEELITESKLRFEVRFQALIEYIDLNANGVFDNEIGDEIGECIEDYGINSFQPIVYTPLNISDDSTLHYFLLNTTDGVFATHIYFPEEFVYINGILISPTQIKIDIEISNFNYTNDNSQLALYTKLFSEGLYDEREETEDEKEGYATEEKEVFTKNEVYTGIFSWKETAIIDGVEMPVLTNELEVECEKENIQRLLFNYPRGNHIYHDPKIGIIIGQIPDSIVPVILVVSIVGVIGIATISVGIILKKRRII